MMKNGIKVKQIIEVYKKDPETGKEKELITHYYDKYKNVIHAEKVIK